MAEEFFQGKVVSQTKETDVLRILKVEVAEKLDFLAGQFTRIGVPVDGDKPLVRAYSFVNQPGSEPHEFYYDVLEKGGNLTPILDGLSAGDKVLVSPRVNGLLHIDTLPDAKTLFLVATGTGIGPFISILGTKEPWARFSKIVLVWSVRKEQDLVYRDRIKKVAAEHGDKFIFLPIVTREEVEGLMKVRVTEALENGRLEEASSAKVDESAQFMLCGSPEMVQQMSDLLKERGLVRNRRSKPGNVTIEKYWN